jgi:hypothetical protein
MDLTNSLAVFFKFVLKNFLPERNFQLLPGQHPNELIQTHLQVRLRTQFLDGFEDEGLA